SLTGGQRAATVSKTARRSAPPGNSASSDGRPTRSFNTPKNRIRTRIRASTNGQSNRRFGAVLRCAGLQCGFPMQPAIETRLRVRYAETDQMGVVYYANYLVWMEVGRVELCKALGFSYRDMEREDGVLLAVAEACCRYRSPARFDDEVIVKAWIEEANPRMVTFAYEMRLAEGDRTLA